MATDITNRPESSEGKGKSPITESLIFLINAYRKYISPLKPATCRFYPTCSEYAVLSLRKYGLFKGLFKAVWRVLRCNPFSKGGIDLP
ncbi:MAG: membrane protein insertion efficiency factor YidD [candidate division WOR-3 bacterium]